MRIKEEETRLTLHVHDDNDDDDDDDKVPTSERTHRLPICNCSMFSGFHGDSWLLNCLLLSCYNV
jgi:hypothetical protein